MQDNIHVFIVGSAGIPAEYGGFETFVEELTKGKQSEKIQYHVGCMRKDGENKPDKFVHNGAKCFSVDVIGNGAAGRMLYVRKSLEYVEKWTVINHAHNVIVYILGCRIGPFLKTHYKKLKRLGISVFVNPDGLEWKRQKWSPVQKQFIKLCEKIILQNCDKIICDSDAICNYIKKEYRELFVKTKVIQYGAYIEEETEESLEKRNKWLKQHNISEDGYYLVVGRFVPDNNYETIIREFMKMDTKKDLVLITNFTKDLFYTQLQNETGFENDARVKFVEPVYDRELLASIRRGAFAYIHGHEVGGTNPSLLEAMASSRLNLVYGISFNKEVAGSSAMYFTKVPGSLRDIMMFAEEMPEEEQKERQKDAQAKIRDKYSWPIICDKYERTFLAEKGGDI